MFSKQHGTRAADRNVGSNFWSTPSESRDKNGGFPWQTTGGNGRSKSWGTTPNSNMYMTVISSFTTIIICLHHDLDGYNSYHFTVFLDTQLLLSSWCTDHCGLWRVETYFCDQFDTSRYDFHCVILFLTFHNCRCLYTYWPMNEEQIILVAGMTTKLLINSANVSEQPNHWRTHAACRLKLKKWNNSHVKTPCG